MVSYGTVSITFFFIIFALVINIFQIYLLPVYYSWQSDKFNLDSSVWCVKGSNDLNLCKFRNVCYDSKQRTMLFFLTTKTVIRGLNNYMDLQKIQLSSNHFHNQFFANISVIYEGNIGVIKEPMKIIKKAFLMSRFKPNNIMHVLHDDLLPLFLTSEYISDGIENYVKTYRLIIHDNYFQGPYFDLFKLFSSDVPLILNRDLIRETCFVCFQEMATGLVQDGIIYDYGFKNVQGPVKNPHLNYKDIIRFSSYIVNKINVNGANTKINIVIITRSKSRKILNLDQVIEMVKYSCKHIFEEENVNILILDLQISSMDDAIKSMTTCDILIGMHGAEMILSLFSKRKIIIFELFPFGIEPDIVSYLKPISELEGSNLVYFYWKNLEKKNSLPHPDAHPLFGGINHLDEMKRKEIENTNSVPAVQCCNDPNYLYHMYQDTWITDDFQKFFEESIKSVYESKINKEKTSLKWFFPHFPLNVTCAYELKTMNFTATWTAPFNVKNSESLLYNIHLRDETNGFVENFTTKSLKLTLRVPRKSNMCPKFIFWIYASYKKNDSRSKDMQYKCSCK